MKSSQRLRNPFTRFGLLVLALILAGLMLSATSSWAAWETWDWATIYSPTNRFPEIQTAQDGAGGMLVAEFDSGEPALTVRVSRVDHTGNEVWGNGGTAIPFEVGSDAIAGPIDVTDDGNLGAYCAYSRIYGTSYYLYLSHFNAAGSVDWTVPVGDYGPHPEAELRLEKADNGALFMVWTRSVGTVDQELIVTKVDSQGAQIWETTAWPDNNNNLDQLVWTAAADQYGLLLGIDYRGFFGAYNGNVQRLDANGNLLWGPQGTQVFQNPANVGAVLPDAAGGAYVMNFFGWGESWAQHVDALGSPTWTAGGIKLFQLNTWPDPATPSFCVDGGGGFYAVDGVEDLFAQHVDIYGGLLWGSPGLQITSLASWQNNPSVAYDGFGGFIVSYEDRYYSEVADFKNRAISAVRIDGFGNKVWGNKVVWWSLPNGMMGFSPESPQTLADGSGGALVVWHLHDDAVTSDEVLASGLGPDGTSPATPTLAYIDPDAGQIGDVQQAFVLGDYLEPSQTYSLVQPGAADMVLTGMLTLSPQLMTGTLNLAGAQAGPFDLELSRGSTTLATLPNAYGVGPMVPCTQDEAMPGVAGQFVGFGSQRRMAFDSQGRVHSAWLEYGTGGVYHLSSEVTAPDHSQVVTPIYDAAYVLRDLSFALGPDGVSHFVVVEENAGTAVLEYFQVEPSGTINFFNWTPFGGVRNPALVVDGAGQVHVVYESDSGGQTAMYHVTVGPLGFGTPQNLNVGNNAVNPDLTADGSGLMLTFVRDFWVPGWREVCYQHFDGTTWAAPVGMYFGVYVKTPSVAFDGVDKLLFSWVLDNTGTAPLLHTMLMTNHVAGPVRWRKGLSSVFACSVAASGPGRFQLLTMEDNGSLPTNILVREGNGEVFYPRRRLNSSPDVDFPYFCAGYNLPGVAVMWAEYNDPLVPASRFLCFEGNPVSAVEMPAAMTGVSAFPNPFNPSTTFSYSQRAAGWAKLVIYNLAGERVRTLVDGFANAGAHSIRWDGRDTVGRVLPSGVYFSRLQLPGGQRDVVSKVTMLK